MLDITIEQPQITVTINQPQITVTLDKVTPIEEPYPDLKTLYQLAAL